MWVRRGAATADHRPEPVLVLMWRAGADPEMTQADLRRVIELGPDEAWVVSWLPNARTGRCAHLPAVFASRDDRSHRDDRQWANATLRSANAWYCPSRRSR